VHSSGISAAGFGTLEEGDRISYEEDRRAQTGRARNVASADG